MSKTMSNCPVCHNPLLITQYQCRACQITYSGEFDQPWLESLSKEQSDFVRLFIIVQGNIKEMEKRLNISYPTVKNRLLEIIRRIAASEPTETDYSDIFNDLEQSFVNVSEAIEMINQRRKK